MISTRSMRGWRWGRQSLVSIVGTPYENHLSASSVIFTNPGRSSSRQMCSSAGSHGRICSTKPSAKSLIQTKSGSSGEIGTESGNGGTPAGGDEDLRGRLKPTAPGCPIPPVRGSCRSCARGASRRVTGRARVLSLRPSEHPAKPPCASHLLAHDSRIYFSKSRAVRFDLAAFGFVPQGSKASRINIRAR